MVNTRENGILLAIEAWRRGDFYRPDVPNMRSLLSLPVTFQKKPSSFTTVFPILILWFTNLLASTFKTFVQNIKVAVQRVEQIKKKSVTYAHYI